MNPATLHLPLQCSAGAFRSVVAPCCTFACIRSLTFRDTNYGHLRGAKVKWESPGVREEEDEEDWRRCVRQCQVDSRPAEVGTKQGGREGVRGAKERGEGEMSDKKQVTETWLTSNLVSLEMGEREGGTSCSARQVA